MFKDRKGSCINMLVLTLPNWVEPRGPRPIRNVSTCSSSLSLAMVAFDPHEYVHEQGGVK